MEISRHTTRNNLIPLPFTTSLKPSPNYHSAEREDSIIIHITHNELVELIKENPLEVLGEEITWTPRNVVLREEQRGRLHPDIVGRDSQDRIVIVEVKRRVLKKTGKPNDAANKISAGEAVGEILHYASAYIRQNSEAKLRLFIVIQEPSLRVLQRVSKPCKFLQSHGINICCIPLSNNAISMLLGD